MKTWHRILTPTGKQNERPRLPVTLGSAGEGCSQDGMPVDLKIIKKTLQNRRVRGFRDQKEAALFGMFHLVSIAVALPSCLDPVVLYLGSTHLGMARV